MSANGISTLVTKELRQKAKLDLAQQDRIAFGKTRPYYDITQLPTQYDDNGIIDNPNEGGLVVGRPWKNTPNILNGLWRSVYTGGGVTSDPTWFDNHPENLASEGPVSDFSIADVVTDNICIQWLGYFQAPHTANYTFYSYSDDEVYFWIGGYAVTGYESATPNIISHSGTGEVTSTISLTAGQYYPIRVQYNNGTGLAYFTFSWSSSFPTYEVVNPTGQTITTTQNSLFKITVRSTSYEVTPFVNAQISIDDVLVVDTAGRGHTVLALTSTGTVISQTTFDTWDGPGIDNMNTALLGYASGTVVAICTYDAGRINSTLRATLNTYYSGTLTDTWGNDFPRTSHIFIGQKI